MEAGHNDKADHITRLFVNEALFILAVGPLICRPDLQTAPDNGTPELVLDVFILLHLTSQFSNFQI